VKRLNETLANRGTNILGGLLSLSTSSGGEVPGIDGIQRSTLYRPGSPTFSTASASNRT
jgi:hypothetical protein